MEDLVIMEKAREMFLDIYQNKLSNLGVLSPSVNQNPVYPQWTVNEYSAMEEDHSKYFLYFAAINKYFSQLKFDQMGIVNVLVLGAGRGRLVDYVKDVLNSTKLQWKCFVIDVNILAIEMLKERYRNDDNIVVLDPIIIRSTNEILKAIENGQIKDKFLVKLVQEKSINLVISELFGSFGDNEFVTEILNATMALLGTRDSNGKVICHSIPVSFMTYISTFTSEILNVKTKNFKEKFLVAGLPSDSIILDTAEVISCPCTCKTNCYEKRINLLASVENDSIPVKKAKKCTNLQTKNNEKRCITGLAGHFRAKLWDEIHIDTRPGGTRNTYFWETLIFPLNTKDQKSIAEYLTHNSILDLKLVRCVKQVNSEFSNEALLNPSEPILKLWYEWQVVGQDNKLLSKCYNKMGQMHSITL